MAVIQGDIPLPTICALNRSENMYHAVSLVLLDFCLPCLALQGRNARPTQPLQSWRDQASLVCLILVLKWLSIEASGGRVKQSKAQAVMVSCESEASLHQHSHHRKSSKANPKASR